MIHEGTAEHFFGNRFCPVEAPLTLGQELRRIFQCLHDRPAKRRAQDFVWSYEELGDGLPDEIPD